jgi:hypothetical protein
MFTFAKSSCPPVQQPWWTNMIKNGAFPLERFNVYLSVVHHHWWTAGQRDTYQEMFSSCCGGTDEKLDEISFRLLFG